MIKEKPKYVAYGIYKMIFWRFLSKETRRRKGTAYKKYQLIIDEIEKFYEDYSPLEEDEKAVAEHIQRKGVETVFPYDFIHNYFLPAALAIKYDKKCQLFYAKRHGMKLYLKQDTYAKALNYYWSLIYEQDKKSPHLYSKNKIKGDILFDIGGAEGFFSLDHLDDFSDIYIFEGDESWLPALRRTLLGYSNKVHIIEYYVGERSTDGFISLDDFIIKNGIDISKQIYIKMDVEGAEMSILKGASSTLKQANRAKLAVCTYHKQNDERDISQELEKYNKFNLTHSDGYLLMFYMNDIEKPYLRRGILRAETEDY